ncbi:glycosyltransferase [Alkalimonas collagenimarina]|uniref:Glycosyltransferase n=1 Tax=Alkalimonas collagenimarina TaxID=400390 RepID=A0ABT9GZ71_9GAMM|nr:glycosyltransferase [Alkalimonas collagenimarina]MDP4536357.1 glycosyltransferase [Alkalimonas collagenimarina]
MKVLHVVSSLNMGGAEQFVVDISAAMNQRPSVQADILSFGCSDDTLCQRCADQGITIHHVNQTSRLQQFLQLRRLLKRFDAVHIHSSHCLFSILLASLFQRDSRLYYTRHNTVVHRSFKWRLIYRLASIRLSNIVFIADIARQDFLRTYPAFQAKSILIYNGIQQVEAPRPDRTNNSVIRLGQVGRFVPLKAQKLLIQALAQLTADQRQAFEVHFFGDGPLLDDCRRQAEPLQQDMSVTFHGLEMDKSRIYQTIDVLVVTSETEGLSLVMLEALSAGCLVIATDVGGNAEIVEHQKSGLLFLYPDANQLSCLLQQLLADNHWHALVKAGEQRFHRIFEQTTCIKSYLALYA